METQPPIDYTSGTQHGVVDFSQLTTDTALDSVPEKQLSLPKQQSLDQSDDDGRRFDVGGPATIILDDDDDDEENEKESENPGNGAIPNTAMEPSHTRKLSASKSVPRTKRIDTAAKGNVSAKNNSESNTNSSTNNENHNNSTQRKRTASKSANKSSDFVDRWKNRMHAPVAYNNEATKDTAMAHSVDNADADVPLEDLPPPPLPPPPPPPPQPQPQQSVPNGPRTTTINGIGLWKSWTRSFNTPLLALLDLYDNAIDASWSVDDLSVFCPSIHAYADNIGGIVMLNNCHSPIPPLSQVLEVYRSSKDDDFSIGENGVGVKQACANLSKLSFILARNDNASDNLSTLSIGVIAESLQKAEGIYLPSKTFMLKVFCKESTNKQIIPQLYQLVSNDHDWYQAILQYGDGNMKNGLHRLRSHVVEIYEQEPWKNYGHVFCLSTHQLRHAMQQQNNSAEERQSVYTKIATKTNSLLDELGLSLPRRYIHIPDSFDIRVGQNKVSFSHWERRLAGLAVFRAPIDKSIEWHKNKDFASSPTAYRLRVFCGFDPARSMDPKRSCPTSLYIYSRQSGRLIKEYEDARSELGLTATGTDYCQGMTVIVDDCDGSLPLNPTKQDLAFGLETHGQIHRQNVWDWCGGIAQFYWTYYFTGVGEKKQNLTDAVKACMKKVTKTQNKSGLRSLNIGQFNEFQRLVWTNVRTRIRVVKRTFESVTLKAGDDTQIQLEIQVKDKSKKKETVAVQRKKLTAPKKTISRKRRRTDTGSLEDVEGVFDDSNVPASLPRAAPPVPSDSFFDDDLGDDFLSNKAGPPLAIHGDANQSITSASHLAPVHRQEEMSSSFELRRRHQQHQSQSTQGDVAFPVSAPQRTPDLQAQTIENLYRERQNLQQEIEDLKSVQTENEALRAQVSQLQETVAQFRMAAERAEVDVATYSSLADSRLQQIETLNNIVRRLEENRKQSQQWQTQTQSQHPPNGGL